MHCEKCGHQAPAQSMFCPACGQQLGSGSDAPPTDTPPEPRDRLRPGPQRPGEPPGEDELWTGSYSPKAMVGSFILAGLATILGLALPLLWNGPGLAAWALAVVLVWAGLLLVLAYRRLTVRYRLTTFRFFHEVGLLSRVANRLEVIDIDDVTVRQGIVERMLGVGTIVVHSSDRTHPELKLPGIEDAKHVADQIDSTRRAERHRRGLHIEAI